MTAAQFAVWDSIAKSLGFEKLGDAHIRRCAVEDNLEVAFRYNRQRKYIIVDVAKLEAAWGDTPRTREILCDARTAIIRKIGD